MSKLNLKPNVDNPSGPVPNLNPLKSIQKFFNLTKSELKLLDVLYHFRVNGTCISNLVYNLGKERSTIQKQIYSLARKGLINRKKISLSEFHELCKVHNQTELIQSNDKGSLYIYIPISRAELMEKLEKKYLKMKSEINQYFNSFAQ